jgi:LPXTG-site transpeptidase (sortase) family protein
VIRAGRRWILLLWAASVALAVTSAMLAGAALALRKPPAGGTPPAGGIWRSPPASVSSPPVVGTGPPTRIRIPAIDVDAPLGTVRLDAHGVLGTPQDWQVAAWYADGTIPGDPGPAVIVGHVDASDGHGGARSAVFYRLRELKVGDAVEVRRGVRPVAFQVVAIREYPKNKFPTGDVYGPTPDPQLRLITCGGDFDSATGHHVDNVVVYAIAA